MTSNSTLVEDLDAIELWVEDVDKFTKGIGTSKSMVDRILFRPATFPKKSTEVLGPAVARLLILPVVAAWRDAGRDPAALSKIKDDLVDTWGYGEACVKTYLDTACARAAQIRLSICAGWLLRTSELYSGDVNAKTVAVGIERAVRQVISAAGLTLIDVAKYNAFFAALKSSEERSHLQIYDDLSRLEATCEQIDVNVTAAMGTQRERLAVVDSQCNENSRTITTLDARVAKVASG